ncbi:Fukutin [Aphelenchoides fujianensis]|nr:Fukutin [Aphelenchoides fujianensis]
MQPLITRNAGAPALTMRPGRNWALAASLVLLVLFPLYFFVIDGEQGVMTLEIQPVEPPLIVDVACLRRLEANRSAACEFPIEVAVFGQSGRTFEKFAKRLEPRFRVTHRVEHTSGRDHVEFVSVDDSTRRLMTMASMDTRLHALDGVGGQLVRVPVDTDRFLRNWANSRFLDCLDLRETTVLRDLLDENDATMFLLGGTLLGWYRECSLIPHTTDLDFAVHSTEINAELVKKIERKYRLVHELGTLEDSFELTVWLAGVSTDLFVMYALNETTSYATVVDISHRRTFLVVYPPISALCTGVLLDFLVHVPCNVEDVLKADYGPKWREDRPSGNYSYLKAPNVVPWLEHTPAEFKKRYVTG